MPYPWENKADNNLITNAIKRTEAKGFRLNRFFKNSMVNIFIWTKIPTISCCITVLCNFYWKKFSIRACKIKNGFYICVPFVNERAVHWVDEEKVIERGSGIYLEAWQKSAKINLEIKKTIHIFALPKTKNWVSTLRGWEGILRWKVREKKSKKNCWKNLEVKIKITYLCARKNDETKVRT